MKYLIIVIFLVICAGCQKEVSLEENCGTVTGKFIRPSHKYIIEVKNQFGEVREEEVGLVLYGSISIGDQYCR